MWQTAWCFQGRLCWEIECKTKRLDCSQAAVKTKSWGSQPGHVGAVLAQQLFKGKNSDAAVAQGHNLRCAWRGVAWAVRATRNKLKRWFRLNRTSHGVWHMLPLGCNSMKKGWQGMRAASDNLGVWQAAPTSDNRVSLEAQQFQLVCFKQELSQQLWATWLYDKCSLGAW